MGLGRHLAKRGIFLALTLVLAIYITVIIANGGGYIDKILKAQIAQDLRAQLANDRVYQDLPPDKQAEIFNTSYHLRLEARGLIKGRWVEKPGERRRCFYRLTTEGRRVLERQKREWADHVDAIRLVLGDDHA